MIINIQARGFRLTSALQDYVHLRLDKSFLRHRGQSPKVEVTLQDINGPRGGEDMQCKMIVTLDGSRPIVVQETAEDMYDAISICSNRVKWAVTRHFERVHSRKRHAVPLYDVQAIDIDALDEVDDFLHYASNVSECRAVS